MERSIQVNYNNTVQEHIKNYEQIIFDKQIWIKEEMRKVAEVTYSYTNIDENSKEPLTVNWKQININTTLFCSLWWLDLVNFNNLKDKEKEKLILEASIKLTEKIWNKKQQINQIIQILKELQNTKKIKEEDLLLINIFTNSLIEKDKLLDYCINWLSYELEKAGINSNLSQTDIEQINKKQKDIDNELFKWEIQDNPEEVIRCYEYLMWKWQENKYKLNKQEQERYNYFFKKIKEKLPNNYVYSKKAELPSYLEQYKDVQIKNNEYILWFNLFIEALIKLKHIVKKDPYAKSISDWPSWVLFPTTEKFNFLTLKRFLTLNTHEIETHNITDHNNEQLIWNIRWAWSTIKDEWLAILMEKFLEHWETLLKKDKITWKNIINIERLPIKNTFTYVLMWEILNNEELLEFLELNEKIEPDTIEVKSRFDRLKRSNNKLVQHKDTSYIRGMFQAAELINQYILSEWKEWINIEDMFLWKVGFDELKDLKKIKEIKEESWEQIDIIMPIFSSDTILFSIEQLLNNKKVNKEEFFTYLQKKYSLFNFSQNKINEVSRKTKENILWVLHIAMKNISNHNLNKISNKKWSNTIKNIQGFINNNHEPFIQRRKKKMTDKRKELI